MKKLLSTILLTGSLFISSTSLANTYTVKDGDTLWLIAKANKVTINDLKSMNQLNSEMITPGQKLLVTSPSSNLAFVSGQALIDTGKQYIGSSYVYGAPFERTDIFDCSSFTKRAFYENGLYLPRTSRQQAEYGTEVSFSNAKPGDLLFFDTNYDGVINHVGIYIDANRMIHAGSSKGVTVSNLKYYWKPRFVKAVSIEGVDKQNLYTLAHSTSTIEYSFKDINNLWNREQVDKLAELGIIKGNEQNKFLPGDYTKRSHMTAFISRALDLTASQPYEQQFNDVDGSEWFVNALTASVEEGIIQGKDDGSFSPNENVTREQAAAIIRRSLNVVGIDEYKLDRTKTVNSFHDSDQIGDWAKEDVEFLYQIGIISGKSDGSFDPKGNLTRAQMAKMIYKMLETADMLTPY